MFLLNLVGTLVALVAIKELTVDLSTPLNHLLYLADYKHFGEHSYAFQDKDIWVELIQSRAAMNDVDVVGVAVSEMINLGIDPLLAMSNIYGTGIEFREI